MSPSAVSTSSTLYGSPSASNRARASSRPIASARPTRGPRRARAASPPRSRRGRPRGSAPGTRSRSRSRSRSAGPIATFTPGMQPAHRLGEQVRGGVAEDGERVGVVVVARRQDLERRAVGQRQPEVARLAVDAREHGLLGELRPDRAGGIERARARREARARSRRGASRSRRARIVGARPASLLGPVRTGPCSASKTCIRRRRRSLSCVALLEGQRVARRSPPSRPGRRPPRPTGGGPRR